MAYPCSIVPCISGLVGCGLLVSDLPPYQFAGSHRLATCTGLVD